MTRSVAVVVQRYGKGVLGGSETLAGDVATCLSKAYDVEVLTTCAKDYESWVNVFPAGESVENGIKIRRFAVDFPRHPLFKPLNVLLRNVPHTMGAERLWMRLQGPYSSSLIRYISDNKGLYDVFVFVTYMYGTTFYCLPLVKEKSVLVPTAHDEPYIRYGIFNDIFRDARRLIYLTEEEKTFVDRLFGLDPGIGVVAGAPINDFGPAFVDFRSKYGIDGDFILYAGRLDRFKGVHILLKYFERYRGQGRNDLKLILCGDGPMKIRGNRYVIKLGLIPEADLYGAMSEAKATVIPSKFESFSYSLLESMGRGTPALVNGTCKVLRGHCERSLGCMSYYSYEDFKTALDKILDEPGIREKLGEAGRRYVQENYSVEAIGKKYITIIDGLINDQDKSF